MHAGEAGTLVGPNRGLHRRGDAAGTRSHPGDLSRDRRLSAAVPGVRNSQAPRNFAAALGRRKKRPCDAAASEVIARPTCADRRAWPLAGLLRLRRARPFPIDICRDCYASWRRRAAARGRGGKYRRRRHTRRRAPSPWRVRRTHRAARVQPPAPAKTGTALVRLLRLIDRKPSSIRRSAASGASASPSSSTAIASSGTVRFGKLAGHFEERRRERRPTRRGPAQSVKRLVASSGRGIGCRQQGFDRRTVAAARGPLQGQDRLVGAVLHQQRAAKDFRRQHVAPVRLQHAFGKALGFIGALHPQRKNCAFEHRIAGTRPFWDEGTWRALRHRPRH